MSGAIFALIACCLACVGGRDQMLLAVLTSRHGLRRGLVAAALATGALTSALAAIAAVAMAGEVPTHTGRLFVAALAMLLAGGESLLRRPRLAAREPTHSLGATAMVLLADQVMDPARFLVFAFAISTEAPLPAVRACSE